MDRVVVVGGGAAGIGAARTLAAAGVPVCIIEARKRLGGRAWTLVEAGMPLDLGCGWLHSAERNPWTVIAEGRGVAVNRTPPAWRHQYRSLGFEPGAAEEAGDAFTAFTKKLRSNPPPSDCAADALVPGERWNGWLNALSGYMNGTDLTTLSVSDYLAYDDAASDHNWRVPSGYGALITATVPGEADVRLGCPVTSIDATGQTIRIETAEGLVHAVGVIVTVPTDVLASGAIRFRPAADDWLHAATCLPLGLANKLFLSLDAPEWLPPDQHLIGRTDRAETGSYTLRPFGRPLVEAFFGGSAAWDLERAGQDATAAFAIDELVALLGSRWRAGLRPIAQSAWAADPWARGSYSHARPGQASARARLSRPLTVRVHFAGEACSATDFSTAHGAYMSGVTAAEALLLGSTLA